MIKNIIFDVGNVLVDWNCEWAFEKLGIEGEAKEAVANATIRSKDWNEYDRSAHKPEELLAYFIEKLPEYEMELRLFWENIGLTIRRYSYTIPWIRALRAAGYRVYILSNYAAWTYEKTREELCFLKEVNGAVFSFQVQQVKPEPEIYQTLLDNYGLVPEESVFLDDREENIRSAERMGIHGILFTSKEQAVCQLASYGVVTVQENKEI